ncbi:MAG: HD domain-containing protein [Bdellovibrionales bacterium]|nr:HD domain-containing protein [Bdellovibrionales bacterium]
MEIRDPIHGTLEISKEETRVLDTPAFQRLRMIKQLGFSEFSFPGATHSRYIHSLGVAYLAGVAFDFIFKEYTFSSEEKRRNYRQVLRLGALLHDIGHGPLSHTSEEVMPKLKELQVDAYKFRVAANQESLIRDEDTKANHEDYTIKFVTDSHLTKELKEAFADFDPYHIALLIDKSLAEQDDFFIDQGLNFRNIFSQLVSSEVDVDRMDYLVRDAYFCGTSYGKVELNWLLGNFRYHVVDNNVHLALDHRAIYTFDDFLLSRHHMYLNIYFHHKSIIYEEMLYRYLTSEDCEYKLPANIEQYVRFTDFSLYENMADSSNPWAQRISQRRSFKVLFENHISSDSPRTEKLNQVLNEAGIETITASSKSRLSKYHGLLPEEETPEIYVVDPYDPQGKPITIDACTEIFSKYEGARTIERLYVSPENIEMARALLKKVNF